jgi:hypothetical protein
MRQWRIWRGRSIEAADCTSCIRKPLPSTSWLSFTSDAATQFAREPVSPTRSLFSTASVRSCIWHAPSTFSRTSKPSPCGMAREVGFGPGSPGKRLRFYRGKRVLLLPLEYASLWQPAYRSRDADSDYHECSNVLY